MKKAQIKKSVSALAMAAVIAVSLFGYGCGAKSASTSSDAGVSGDFTGTAKGFGGDVSVTLTLTDGAITGSPAEREDEPACIHMAVENIRIDHLIEDAKIMADAILALAAK